MYSVSDRGKPASEPDDDDDDADDDDDDDDDVELFDELVHALASPATRTAAAAMLAQRTPVRWALPVPARFFLLLTRLLPPRSQDHWNFAETPVCGHRNAAA